MIGAIIGGVASLASSIIGGVQSKKAAQAAENELAKRQQRNEAWYDRRYNEDYLQTAEAQAALTEARNMAREQMSAARGTAAVMGDSTGAGVARAQEAANRMVSDTVRGIAAQGTARKDAVESQYMQNADSIGNAYQSIYNQRAANSAAAASSGMQAGMGMINADIQSYLDSGRGLFSNIFKKKEEQS